jgi:hypothetical protein
MSLSIDYRGKPRFSGKSRSDFEKMAVMGPARLRPGGSTWPPERLDGEAVPNLPATAFEDWSSRKGAIILVEMGL